MRDVIKEFFVRIGNDCYRVKNREGNIFDVPEEALTKLTQKQSDEFEEMIEDIDLELFLTDIKDKKGNKIKESDELMKLFGVFWEHVKKKIKQKLKEK